MSESVPLQPSPRQPHCKTDSRMEESSDEWLHELLLHALEENNGSMAATAHPDTTRPVMRRSLAKAWPMLATLYGLLMSAGVGTNACVLGSLLRRPRIVDHTCIYIANLALANLVQCGIVLPASLTVLILQNWVFGRALCYCLPMIQDIPLHVTMLTFLAIAADRYRLVLYPCKPRLPVGMCAAGTWLIALCIVVPYPFYITYIDLGLIREELHGIGLCVVNLLESMQDYMRGLFLFTYVLPLSAIAFLYVRVSQELKVHEGPLAVTMYESHSRTRRESSSSEARDEQYGLYEAELDVCQEKRTHKYLVSMVTVYAICMCPLMFLRLVKQVVVETYDNSAHYDFTYILFVWFAFVHTCFTPAIFASWVTTPITKERVRSYFRISKRSRMRRRRESAVDPVVPPRTSGETPVSALDSEGPS